MRKKRIKIIFYAVVAALIIVGELTETTELLLLGLLLTILFIVFLIQVYRFYSAQKIYKYIVDERRYIRGMEKSKYKMFFRLRGKQAEEMEEEYDESIASSRKFVKDCINYLEVEKQYLSKRQKAALETAKNEIRETGGI